MEESRRGPPRLHGGGNLRAIQHGVRGCMVRGGEPVLGEMHGMGRIEAGGGPVSLECALLRGFLEAITRGVPLGGAW